MFEKIHFISTESTRKLTSKKITPDIIQSSNYNSKALVDTSFSIWGSVDAFPRPPISDFVLQHLYFMEDFDIFHYGKGSFTERQNFRSHLIAYTYSGEGRLIYREKEYYLTKGDGFFIDCSDYQKYEALSNSWDVAILHLGGPLLPFFHEQFMLAQSPFFHELNTGRLQEYLEQLLSLYSIPQQNRDWKASACIDNLLTHLLTLQIKNNIQTSSTSDDIRFLIIYMENNFNQPLTLDYLSNFVGISKYYLSREFKKYTGFSPNDYLISLRVNRAKSLLINSNLTVTQIAHEVGIHSINNFINLFKKKVGMTPIQYKKNPK